MIIPATEKDFPALIELWEFSVRASHHFLPENYLQEIKALLPDILQQVKIYTWTENNSVIKGFAGVAGDKMEMLFIHPDSMRNGLGRRLTEFCIHALHAKRVDVNEQNEQAVRFYEKMGYKQIGRQELDSMGRPFPLLEMQYAG